MALNSEIQTNQILTNDDEVCIPRLSSILLAVLIWSTYYLQLCKSHKENGKARGTTWCIYKANLLKRDKKEKKG